MLLIYKAINLQLILPLSLLPCSHLLKQILSENEPTLVLEPIAERRLGQSFAIPQGHELSLIGQIE